MNFPNQHDSTATFSPCLQYRYTLTRGWELLGGNDKGACMFLMLNPSTADARVNDPTIRRGMGFARAWGYSSLFVANIFAWRATDPKELYSCADPVGRENDRSIIELARASALIVAAWGVHGAYQDRGKKVLKRLNNSGHSVHHLGLTKEGHPKHPLYLPATSTPQLLSGPTCNCGLAEHDMFCPSFKEKALNQ